MKKIFLLLLFKLAYTALFSQYSYSASGGKGARRSSYGFSNNYTIGYTRGTDWLTVTSTTTEMTWTVKSNSSTVFDRSAVISTTEKMSNGVYTPVNIIIYQSPALPSSPPDPPPFPLPTCQGFSITGPASLQMQVGLFDYYYSVSRDTRVPSSATAQYSWQITEGTVSDLSALNTPSLHFKANVSDQTTAYIRLKVTSTDGCSATYDIFTYP